MNRILKTKETTIAELQAKMNSGECNARSVAEMYLERIDELDRQEPAIHAVIELNPDALSIADEMDRERKKEGARGLLHGIPILIKDNIHTADRMMTTAGTLALDGWVAQEDAFLVGKLREAGAVILGKTNLSEWANFRSTRSTSGWSSRGGQTRNPYALDRNPSGSSSGSAVAVAAHFCSAAIGTETNGSIISPAQVNGIVGIKPTVGLISRSGIIPISHTQDTAGPMGRTVEDAVILLSAIAGEDPQDPVTAGSNGNALSDYTVCLDKQGMKGASVGIARNYFGFNKRVDRIMEACIDVMKQLGATVIDPVNMGTVRDLRGPGYEVLLYEFKEGLNRYLSRINPPSAVTCLRDIIDYNKRHGEKVMPYFGQEIFIASEKKGALTETAYLESLALCRRLSRTEGIDAVMAAHRLDAIVAPSGGPAWLTDFIHGDHPTGGSAGIAAIAGYPSITLPAGYVFGLPVGISFFGGAYQEPVLIRLAYALEQAMAVRQPPAFLPTVDFS